MPCRRAKCKVPKRDRKLRLNLGKFGLKASEGIGDGRMEPKSSGANPIWSWGFLPPRNELFELVAFGPDLEDVCDVALAAVDTRFVEELVEALPRRPDERATLDDFVLTGSLPYDSYSCRPWPLGWNSQALSP